MNTTPAKDSRKNGIITAIGVLVLMLGAATDNAIAMLVMALVGLAVLAIVDRQRLRRNAWFLLLVVAAAAAAVGFAFAMF